LVETSPNRSRSVRAPRTGSRAVRATDAHSGVRDVDPRAPAQFGRSDTGVGLFDAATNALVAARRFEDVVHRTGMDCWFIQQLSESSSAERELKSRRRAESLSAVSGGVTNNWAFSDPQIADCAHDATETHRRFVARAGVVTTFKTVDTSPRSSSVRRRITTARTKIRARSARSARDGDHLVRAESNWPGHRASTTLRARVLVCRHGVRDDPSVNLQSRDGLDGLFRPKNDRLYFEPPHPKDVAEVWPPSSRVRRRRARHSA